jgi:hypothetical protein
MEGIKKLDQRQVDLIGRIIDSIEAAAHKMRAHTGNIMTAEDVVTMLKNHAAVGRDFTEREKQGDSTTAVSTPDGARKENEHDDT